MNAHNFTCNGKKNNGVDYPPHITSKLIDLLMSLTMEAMMGKILFYLRLSPEDHDPIMELVKSCELMDYAWSCPALLWFQRDTSMDVEEV